MKPSGRPALAVLALSVALLTPSAQACDEDAAPQPTPAKGDARAESKPVVPKSAASAKPPETQARGQSLPRMVVTRDKETGQLRAATPEEIRALNAAPRATLLKATGSPVATTLPDGTKVLDLTDRYFSMAVAKKGTDGRVEERCVGSEKERSEFLSAAGPVPAPARPVGTADEK